MWNVLVLLTIFFMRRRIRFDGELFAIYIAMYSFGRFFIETLRTDQLLLPGTDIPVSMVVAAVIFCFCLLLILRKRGSGTRS